MNRIYIFFLFGYLILLFLLIVSLIAPFHYETQLQACNNSRQELFNNITELVEEECGCNVNQIINDKIKSSINKTLKEERINNII